LWHQAQIAAGAAAGRDCTLGKGAIVGAGSSIGNLVKIGNYACVLDAQATPTPATVPRKRFT
jgi:UDP-3-O-[3-hydroxymyristoyl] glucosamine N-acyltransferase